MALGVGLPHLAQRLLLGVLGGAVDLLEELVHHAVAAAFHLGDGGGGLGPARGRGSRGAALLVVGVDLGGHLVHAPVQVRIAGQLLGVGALDAAELTGDARLRVALAGVGQHLAIALGDGRGHRLAEARRHAESAGQQPAERGERAVHRVTRRVQENLRQDG